METVLPQGTLIKFDLLQETINDFKEEIIDHVFGAKKGMFENLPSEVLTTGEAFERMKGWIEEHYLGK